MIIGSSGTNRASLTNSSNNSNNYDIVSDLSDSNELKSNNFNQILIPDFGGGSRELSVESWLARYEGLVILMKWDDNQIVLSIGNHLKSEALDWYMTMRKINSSLTFEMLKEFSMNRFALWLTDPVIDFANLKYHQCKGMLDYYKQKRRLALSQDYPRPTLCHS